MAHIPKEDIRELWGWTPGHNWSALEQTLHQHRDKKDGISDNLVVAMTAIVKQLEQSGQPYPSSPDQLYDILNQRLQSEPKVREEAARAD